MGPILCVILSLRFHSIPFHSSSLLCFSLVTANEQINKGKCTTFLLLSQSWPTACTLHYIRTAFVLNMGLPPGSKLNSSGTWWFELFVCGSHEYVQNYFVKTIQLLRFFFWLVFARCYMIIGRSPSLLSNFHVLSVLKYLILSIKNLFSVEEKQKHSNSVTKESIKIKGDTLIVDCL